MNFAPRTHDCGVPREEDAGTQATFNGWAHKVRDLGGLIFIDLRDRTGIMQLFFDPEKFPEAKEIKPETCLSVSGTIQPREDQAKTDRLPTGHVELRVESYQILSDSKVLPFQLSDEEQMQKVNEELRVKHRYLDLRRQSLQRKLHIRASCVRRIRSYLDQRNFTEIETPVITKSTPEGARDYLVPYRVVPGEFYALPQSPQQYKQLLMVGGMERYYQIAKCFRDEAQRADRQPEFTQLDLEMSFCSQEDILSLAEDLTIEVINGVIDEFDLDFRRLEPFARLTFDEAMDKYGTDKPDIRFGLELFDLNEQVKDSEFGVFANTVKDGGSVRGVLYPGGASLSRKEIGQLESMAKEAGAMGLATLALIPEQADGAREVNGQWMKSPILKFLSDEEASAIAEQAKAESGDIVLIVASDHRKASESLGRLRTEIGSRLELADPKELMFVWVVDFPLVEWNEDEQRWDPSHHPFTSPKAEDMEKLETDIGAIRADCYDLVCNGLEWASGSIRIHRADVQERVFKAIGISDEEIETRFGHIIEAFRYGAPPHGGIAPGIDRLVMLLTRDDNIREVIAFPKVGQGADPMMDAPSPIDEDQWKELGLTPPKG